MSESYSRDLFLHKPFAQERRVSYGSLNAELQSTLRFRRWLFG